MLVDVDGQLAPGEPLRVRDEECASSRADVVGVEEQRLDGGARISQEADRGMLGGFEYPPLDRVVRELLRHEWPQRRHVGLAKEVVRGADGAFPQSQQLLAVLDSRETNVNDETCTE